MPRTETLFGVSPCEGTMLALGGGLTAVAATARLSSADEAAVRPVRQDQGLGAPAATYGRPHRWPGAESVFTRDDGVFEYAARGINGTAVTIFAIAVNPQEEGAQVGTDGLGEDRQATTLPGRTPA